MKQQPEDEVMQPLFKQPVCVLNDINILVPKVKNCTAYYRRN